MGGAVSSGRDNNELIDNLMGSNYIRTPLVEKVFRAVDRADYTPFDSRNEAFKDLAWRNGPLHQSAPCIYGEVMEGLELREGLSFLNIGSGTGYLSTLVGMILGAHGVNHGVEVHSDVIAFANKRLLYFIETSAAVDEFEFCKPRYTTGNGLCLAPLQKLYDRVYCGAGCPEEYQNYFKQLIKVGGILVMPLNENLLQVRRVSDTEWTSRTLLYVSFTPLRVPTREETAAPIHLEEIGPPQLQSLARSAIRVAVRNSLYVRNPELAKPLVRKPVPPKNTCPRRICIPIEDDNELEALNAFHDLDRANGADEMNALLGLIVSMGQNRMAGSLRFDPIDVLTSSSSSSSNSSTSSRRSDSISDSDEESDSQEQSNKDVKGSNNTEKSTSNDESENQLKETLNNKDGSVETEEHKVNEKNKAEDKPSDEMPDNETESNDNVAGSVVGIIKKMDWDEVEEKDEDSDKMLEVDSEGEDSGKESNMKNKKDKNGKREKMDSGIGEENSASLSKTDESDSKSDCSEDMEHRNKAGKRSTAKAVKRARCVLMAHSSDSSDEETYSGGKKKNQIDKKEIAKSKIYKHKKRATENPDLTRRIRISLLMMGAVKSLPLPIPLQNYVNLNRAFL